LSSIFLTGINHTTANADIRERLYLSDPDISTLLAKLNQRFEEAVVLSTCNRLEIYIYDSSPDHRYVVSCISSLVNAPEKQITSHSYTKSDREAVYHLMSVAAGLDSVVLGESQILGQVRQAWEKAASLDTTGPVLNTLFRYALQAGKDVRTKVPIGRGATSVAHAAVELTRSRFGSLRDLCVVVLGAGEMGRLAARNLRSAGVKRITIINRTYERAKFLAEDIGGEAVPIEDMDLALASADVLITCSLSPRPLVLTSHLEHAVRYKQDRQLLVIDIAIPRNVDPQVRSLPSVSLYDMDDIQEICNRNRHARKMAARLAHKELQYWVEEFFKWQHERLAVPLIRDVRGKAEQIRKDRLEKTFGILKDLTDEQRYVIDAMSKSIVNAILHNPTTWIKQVEDDDLKRLFADMWGVNHENPGK